MNFVLGQFCDSRWWNGFGKDNSDDSFPQVSFLQLHFQMTHARVSPALHIGSLAEGVWNGNFIEKQIAVWRFFIYFLKWAPEMNVVAYIGDGKSREIIRQYECEDPETRELIFNVLLTSYEMVGKDKEFFVSMSWSNIVIDEAHR